MLNAHLESIHLSSPDPEAMAHFYANTYGLELVEDEGCGAFACTGVAGEIRFPRGGANALQEARFRLADERAWVAFNERLPAFQAARAGSQVVQEPMSVSVQDPDGNRLRFLPPDGARGARVPGPAPVAVLQHFALRTPDPQRLMEHYLALGFTLSDEVRDADRALRACFLRSDPLHHSIALFKSPEKRFDHQSFETEGWAALQQWADRMASLRVPMVWGVGRHGPGNDVFFMVEDPDRNLVEISAEIEHCAPGRPPGQWPHEERTLNLWGKAIMRS